MFTDSKAFSGFSVDNLDTARQFYSQTLGLELDEQEGMGFSLKLATGGQVFVYPKENHQPATFTILNFPVENIDKTAETLAEKGIQLEQYNNPDLPQDEKGIARGRAIHMGPDIAWFKDPAGNILSILQN